MPYSWPNMTNMKDTDSIAAQSRPNGGPHVLLVAWGYPPSRGGGVYRALATANRFAERGWRVTVLTAERETFERYTGTDPSLESRIQRDIKVVRIPFAWPVLDNDIRTWSWLRVNQPKVWRRLRTWRDKRSFPEVGYGPWRRPLEAAVERIHAADPVDLVIATANPNVSFAGAHRLHKLHRVPYVMDYRDAWLLDVFSGNRLHDERSRAARYERRYIESAEQVWFVNDPLRDWHRDLYPAHAAKMRTVANGFDRELAPDPQHREPVGDRPLVFGYLGTVTPKVPLTEFIAGWRTGREMSTALSTAQVHIHGYLGYYAQPRADMIAAIHNAADAGLSYRGPVGKGEIRAVYESFDVLLLMLGKGRYVTSGKVFEYLATGLPVVSVHDPGNAASDILRDYPLWFPAHSLAPTDIASALAAAADSARTIDDGMRKKAHDFGASFRRELQLDPAIDSLMSVASGGRQ